MILTALLGNRACRQQSSKTTIPLSTLEVLSASPAWPILEAAWPVLKPAWPVLKGIWPGLTLYYLRELHYFEGEIVLTPTIMLKEKLMLTKRKY